MPGYNNSTLQNPGRSAPVRGVASQQASTSSNLSTSDGISARPDAAIAMSPLFRPSTNQQYSYQPSSSSNHPSGWDRPYSSGVPAPAVAVPIFRASHAAAGVAASPHGARRHASATQLPDSPPDTPPHSPGLQPVRLPSFVEPRELSRPQRISPPRASDLHEQHPLSWTLPSPASAYHADVSSDAIYTGQTPCDSELETDAEPDFSDEASQATLDQLTEAAQSLLLHPDANRSKSQTNDSGISTHSRNALSVELMPATPEISPDNDVRHHAQKSAHTFLHRIFANVPQNLAVEDAGVELVSPGWSGAVIKSGALASNQVSSSFTSTSSSDSSADTQRTLYVSMPSVVDASLLREQVLAVLDAASEKLGCESVMVCLNKAMRDFATVLHGLCYVGGALVAAAKEAEELGGGQNKLPNTDPISGLQLQNGLVLVAIEL